MRRWWNWYTRWSKKPMPKGLRVQVSLDAPNQTVRNRLSYWKNRRFHYLCLIYYCGFRRSDAGLISQLGEVFDSLARNHRIKVPILTINTPITGGNMVRAQRRKFHYIYRITNKLNGKFYIGMHSTDNLDDGYFGSGKYLWNSIRKHGKENHTLEILEQLDSRESLVAREKEIVNKEFLENVLSMNLKVGGDGGFPRPDQSFWNEAHAVAFHSAGAKASNLARKGKGSSDFHKEQTPKGVKAALVKNGNHWIGKHQTDEHKRKIGEINSKLQSGSGNSQFGTCWVCQPNESRKIKKEDLSIWLDLGWKSGRIWVEKR